ncbi:hypothetical protein Hanom_Chr01g00030411 [Helianthus anomalus]
MSVAPSLVRVPTPPHDPEPAPELDPTRDELLLSLQLQFEILGRRVLELGPTPPCPQPCPCQPTFVPPHLSQSASFVPSPAASVPPHSSSSPFAHPPGALTPFPGFDAHFLTVKQHISYLLRRVYELEVELAHVRCLLFFPPPPPPSVQ